LSSFSDSRFFFLRHGSNVVQAGLELEILLHHSSEC
jgi:hypothetical protein